MIDPLKLHADGLTLVYHEARHVRFLVKKGFVDKAGWQRFISLPTNRFEAWRQLQPLRRGARSAVTISEAAGQFSKYFAQDLEGLLALYSNPNWKHSAMCGGNAWRDVTQSVLDLKAALENGDQQEIRQACWRLVGADHNNGKLRDKLVELDREVGAAPDVWWLTFA